MFCFGWLELHTPTHARLAGSFLAALGFLILALRLSKDVLVFVVVVVNYR